MKNFLLCLLVLLLSSCCTVKKQAPQLNTLLALGEPENAQDLLALQHPKFNATAAANNIPVRTSIGILDHTFGDSLGSVILVLDRINPKYFRIHFINTVCVRNGNCGSYEYGYRHNVKSFDQAIKNRSQKILVPFRERVKLYKQLSLTRPATGFIVSPALEHDLSKESYRILADEVLKIWPDVMLANSVNLGNYAERYKGAWIERHGKDNFGDAEIVSTDGDEVTDINIPQFKSNTRTKKLRAAWTRGYNCRSNSVVFVDPRARKNCADRGIIEEVAHIFDDRGTAPNFAATMLCTPRAFKAPDIWKPLADDHGTGDTRANKPVLISSAFSQRSVNVITKDGQKVGQLGFYGTFSGGGFRWYSGTSGGDSASGYTYEKRSRAVSGSPYVWLQQRRVCRGPIVTGMRQGATR